LNKGMLSSCVVLWIVTESQITILEIQLIVEDAARKRLTLDEKHSLDNTHCHRPVNNIAQNRVIENKI
jgi:hypothetical protein